MGGAETTDEGYHALRREFDRVKPFSVLLAMNNAPAVSDRPRARARGPNLTFSTACSSSAVAIGEAARRIAAGEVESR